MPGKHFAGAAAPIWVSQNFLTSRALIRRLLAASGIGPEDDLARILSTRAFGHTGFTGTSLWCDPERDIFVVCLTNAVHPSRNGNKRIAEVRMSVYGAAVECVERQQARR